MRLHLNFLLFLFFFIGCTNYSVSKSTTVPPILIYVSTIPTGRLIVMRATNPEIFFAGYKLYVGANDSAARNPASLVAGADCLNRDLGIRPNLPIQYSIEVSDTATTLSSVNTGEAANRVCRFPVSLTSGQYISIRSLLLSFQPGAQGYNYSASSNSLIVP